MPVMMAFVDQEVIPSGAADKKWRKKELCDRIYRLTETFAFAKQNF
jgi:hypothetical protein